MVKEIHAYRFSPPSEVFANSTENAGFCVPPGNCPGSGLLDVSVCKEGEAVCWSEDSSGRSSSPEVAVFCLQELPSSCLHHTSTRRSRGSWRLFLG